MPSDLPAFFVIPDDQDFREACYRRYCNMPEEKRTQVASSIKLAGIGPSYDTFGADDCIAILMFHPGMKPFPGNIHFLYPAPMAGE